MSSAKEKETESNSSISGSTQLPISTPIQFFGILSALCKSQFQITTQTHQDYASFLKNPDIEFWNFFCFSFYVDGTPIREFKNRESIGVAFPKNQPMRLQSSLWNADDWATRGGLVKTDWTQAPFTASYRNFNEDACIWSSGKSSCGSNSSPAAVGKSWYSQELDSDNQGKLNWVQKNYMIYNYCTDTQRFPQGLPAECNATA